MLLLVNLAILLVVGYFILVNTRKRKYDQTGDVLPRYTTQRSKAEIEKESQGIIKLKLKDKFDDDFKKINSKGFTGFLDYYLQYTRNDETLTTTAESGIVKTLSENDLQGDLTLFSV